MSTPRYHRGLHCAKKQVRQKGHEGGTCAYECFPGASAGQTRANNRRVRMTPGGGGEAGGGDGADKSSSNKEAHKGEPGRASEQMIQAGECLRHLRLCKAVRGGSGSGHEPELSTLRQYEQGLQSNSHVLIRAFEP